MFFNLNLLHLLLVLAAAVCVRMALREIRGRSMSPSRLAMLPLVAVGMTFVFLLFFLSLQRPLWLFGAALLLGVAVGAARGVTMKLRFDHMWQLVRPSRHLVLQAAHPSPLSARNFLGCRHFSQADAFLKIHGAQAVRWDL